jgi:carboxylesterase type B
MMENLCSQMPNIPSLETGLQDVVVVLHDGGFSHGSGDIAMYGPDYLLDHDVVMVTCNYRLGALGKMISVTNSMEQSPSHIFFKIHFNIILLSMPVSPK